MKTLKTTLILITVLILCAGCAQASASTPEPASQTAPANTPTHIPPTLAASDTPAPAITQTDTVPAPTRTRQATPTPTATPSMTPLPKRDPADWENWPVVPEGVSASMIELYQAGLEAGNDPHRFSKVGDCQNITTYFLATFDKPGRYDLGDYSALQDTIDWYAGSYKRESAAVRGGLNVAAVQNALFTRSKECKKGENPLACEVRANQPSIVLVSYEELWDANTEKYAKHYESLIQYLLERNILPILGTTANNKDANRIVADLAVKYDLPVWNLWAALQPLRRRGIADGFHLTQWGNIFDFTPAPRSLSGWHARNLTALQALDAVHQVVQAQPERP